MTSLSQGSPPWESIILLNFTMMSLGTWLSSRRALGYVYMLLSTTSFTGTAAVSKMIGSDASSEQKLFWRLWTSWGGQDRHLWAGCLMVILAHQVVLVMT